MGLSWDIFKMISIIFFITIVSAENNEELLAKCSGDECIYQLNPGAIAEADPDLAASRAVNWTIEEVGRWLKEAVLLPDGYIELFATHKIDGSKFLRLAGKDFEDLGIPWGISSILVNSLNELKSEILNSLLPGVGEQQKKIFIQSTPYAWPYNGELHPHNTALVVIDMQIDFCAEGGYVSRMGYSIEPLRKPIKPIQNMLSFFRTHGFHIIHTREGHRPDLSDVPDNKRWRSGRIHAGIGDPSKGGKILVRGSSGWDIIPELAPLENETIIDKPGKGAFFATDLDFILRLRGIRNLIFAGVTTDVCVTTSMREANDRGFECLLLEDCCGATDPNNHQAAINMVHMSGGIFGATVTSDVILNTLRKTF